MKILLLVLVFAGVGYADTPTQASSGESAVYFEPTQADKTCCSLPILAQQEKYKAAVGEKNYSVARAQSLFFFTRAWSWFNEAMSIARSEDGWMNVAELKKAQDMLTNAQADIEQAKLKGHHAASVSTCEKLVVSNRNRIEEQIAALLK